MEALRTRNDSLQWEVQRLDVQNRRLREQNPEASECVDREAKLEKAKNDVAEMTSRLRAWEEQQSENARATEEAEHRATEAERRAAELEEKMRELQVPATRQQVVTGDVPDAAERARLEQALQES